MRFLSKPTIAKNGGDEGGELLLEKPDTNTSINTGVTVDVYQNKLRFFEQGGTARGAYIDVTACSAGVGTNLLGSGGTTIPSGSLQMYAPAVTQSATGGTVTTTAPSGWLLANGDAVSRTTYSALFTAIGTTYGTGDGSTTFNLPDMRSRMPIGAGTGTGLSARTLGTAGGAESKTIASGNLPTHTHTITHGHANTFSITVDTNTFNVGNSGLAHTHSFGPTNTNGHNHSYLGGSVAASGTTRSVLSSAGSINSGTIQAATDQISATTGNGSVDHGHTANHAHTSSISGGVTDNTTSSSGNGGFANTALDVMNPYLPLNFIIKT